MKKLLCSILAVYLVGGTLAARAGLTPISNDPYTSAMVLDVSTGTVLFEDGADKPVYPASVVKLMVLLLILERVDAGQISLTDQVNITAEAAKIGGSQVYLKEGETFSLEELLCALSIKSANDVAAALAIHLAGTMNGFVKLMNQRAAELGMKSTTFTSVHGLPPASGQKPDTTTARDIATLSMEIVRHPKALYYTSLKEKWFRNNTFEMLTHNRLLKEFPGCDGLKTGYFSAAGFSISATALRNDRRVIAVVMGCRSRPTRDEKAKELLGYGFMNLPEIKVPEKKTKQTTDAVASSSPGKKGSFAAALGKFFRFLGKLLIVLIVAAVVVATILFTLHIIRQHRDRWKYKF